MARGQKTEETKESKILWECEEGSWIAKAYWKNPKEEGKTYGLVWLVYDNKISIKASLVDGNNGVFFSLPNNVKDKKYYPEVSIQDKDLREDLNKLAQKCAKLFA